MKKTKRILAQWLTVCLLLGLVLEPSITVGASRENTEMITKEVPTVSGTDTEMFSAAADVSHMVYQAGGWGISGQQEENIMFYAATEWDRLKREILKALQEEAGTLDVSGYGLVREDWKEIQVVFAEVLNENPELFYVDSYIGYSYYSSGGIVNIIFHYGDFTEDQKRAYAQQLEKASALVTSEMTDVEKALTLHDYLAQNCSYAYREYLDNTLNSCPRVFSAYGALVDGKAVCQGYALAYQTLLRKVGVDASLCSSNSMNHAWNVVFADNNWYHVDVTWDDPIWNKEGQARHEYFLLSDREMENRGHENWEDSVDCFSYTYDDWWWRNVESRIVLTGHSYIFIEESGDNRGFRLMEKTNEATTEKYVNHSCWDVWGENGGYYIGVFSYLSVQGDYLLFNDKLNLYVMKITDTTPETVYTYEDGEGYLYGAMLRENGTARINIAATPNNNSDSYVTVDLSDKISVSYTVGGRVNCPGNSGEELNIQFLDKDGNIVYKTIADNSQYTVANVTQGSYVVRVNGKNYVSRDYTVTVNGFDVNVDVELWRAGDVNGDGNITAMDKKLLFNHMAGIVPFTGYALSVADLNGDGKITARDKKLLFDYMAGTARM